MLKGKGSQIATLVGRSVFYSSGPGNVHVLWKSLCPTEKSLFYAWDACMKQSGKVYTLSSSGMGFTYSSCCTAAMPAWSRVAWSAHMACHVEYSTNGHPFVNGPHQQAVCVQEDLSWQLTLQ